MQSIFNVPFSLRLVLSMRHHQFEWDSVKWWGRLQPKCSAPHEIIHRHKYKCSNMRNARRDEQRKMFDIFGRKIFHLNWVERYTQPYLKSNSNLCNNKLMLFLSSVLQMQDCLRSSFVFWQISVSMSLSLCVRVCLRLSQGVKQSGRMCYESENFL